MKMGCQNVKLLLREPKFTHPQIIGVFGNVAGYDDPQ